MFTPPVKIGFVPGHRGFFSEPLARRAREATLQAMNRAGLEVIVPQEGETRLGCVESRAEAEFCAALFRRHEVDAIVIGAMNFGDEQAAAWTIKQARLDVPVMIFGCPEEGFLTPTSERRDAFCGLLSIAEALRQIGARYTVGQRPVTDPAGEAFARDLDEFTRVCRVVKGLRQARYAQVGTRPDAFWTCRYSEKAVQRMGPTVVVLDLSEALAGASRLTEADPLVEATLQAIQIYADTSSLSKETLLRIACFEAFLTRWGQENAIDGFAVQCWTSIQQNYGCCACTTLSRFCDRGTPAACEADIPGLMSMHACQLAAGGPAALADWNNLHHEDENLVNLWHCGVFPRRLGKDLPRLERHAILMASGAATPDQAGGVVELELEPMPVTLLRLTHEENSGWKALLVEGQIEQNASRTGGSFGWCRVPDLQRLYREVLLRHFPHHVALTRGHLAPVLREAFGNYHDMPIMN